MKNKSQYIPLTPIDLRREIHQYPELFFQEKRTSDLIEHNINLFLKEKELDLKSKNIEVTIIRPLPTAILVEYLGDQKNSNWALFRADLDGLPMVEETGLPFASQNGAMHACGHDLHASILYGFLLEVIKIAPNKNLLFLFQPAEEEGGGAQKILVSDVFHKYENLKGCFALHVTDEWEVGTIASNGGTLFASAHAIDINFKGKSAHLAFPEMAQNAFTALRIFLDKAHQWEKEHRQEIPSLLWGYGKITAGEVRNILPSQAYLAGSLRALNHGETERFFRELERILKDVETETGVNGEIKTVSYYPSVINSEKLYQQVKNLLIHNCHFIETAAKMTGEDFGFFTERYPSLMVWLGSRAKNSDFSERKGLHHPEFNPSEESIKVGISFFHICLESLSF